jgi:hypothetical protein
MLESRATHVRKRCTALNLRHVKEPLRWFASFALIISQPSQFLTVAMAQILVEGGNPAANLRRAVDYIHLSAERGADIVLLPECLNLGWTHPSARDAAQPIPGPHCDVLMEAAAQSGIPVVAGLVERAGDKIYNSAVVISETGKLLHLHRKIHELDFAQDLYATGDRLGVVETPLGVLGVSICADNFPESPASGMCWRGWAHRSSFRLRRGPWAPITTTSGSRTVSYGAARTRSFTGGMTCPSWR